ncbi:hypothetical protein GGX14DRAFT_483677 [Mycena pura]|uniref:F-box domain-containing protein n=1 Tax=Mycena pura TaxID=153505 RepID=A0AAD6UTT6_9AGAR|nr:hypothetical protein GGX14DRAFT_483677 [Mycena pura]
MSSRTKCGATCSAHCPALPQELQLPASPCPEHLVTNSVPSDLQTNEIYTLILSTEAEISDLDAKIVNLQRALDRLKLKRAGLTDFVKSHRGVVSTIRRLPSELLAEIFSHSLDASDSFHSPEALLHVVSVCKRWRTIALASPVLWRRIRYDYPSHRFATPTVRSCGTLHQVGSRYYWIHIQPLQFPTCGPITH